MSTQSAIVLTSVATNVTAVAVPTRATAAPPPIAPQQPGATLTLPPFSLAWAAGFADGEACIHIARQSYRSGRSDTYQLRVYITQNDLAVLEHFRKGVGIHAGLYKVKRTPKHNKQVHTLNYHGKHAMALLALLLPHLVRKRAEAQIGLRYWIEGRAGMRPGPKGLPAQITAIRVRLYRQLQRIK